jgi:O-antigen/teichoic acid export membrane protein
VDTVSGMGKTTARSSFKLFIGVSISSVITAVSVLIVMNLLPPAEFGLIATAMIFPSMLSLFKDWGMNSAMIKYLAQYNAEKDNDGVRSVLLGGLVFELLMGSMLTLICYFGAGFIATTIFEMPNLKFLIEFSSLTIISDSFLKVAQSTFTGMERMEYYSLTQILNSVIRCSVAPLLVLMDFGVLGAIQGQIVAQIVAGLVGLVIYFIVFLRHTGLHTKIVDRKMLGTIKTMFKYSVPLSISVIAGGFLPHYYTTLLNQSTVLPTAEAYTFAMGNYSSALNFSVIITFFTIPINTVLFPAFSKLRESEDKTHIQIMFKSSVKYGALLTVPVTLMIMVLSKPLVYSLVDTSYIDAPFYLALYCIIYLYATMGNLSTSNVLNGQGRTDLSMKMSLLTLVVGLALSVIFIIPLGVVGLLISNTLCGLPSTFLGLRWIKNFYGATVDWMSSAKIFLASCVAAVATYLLVSQLPMNYWLQLFIGGVAFLAVYLVAAPLLNAVNKKDVHTLREMLSGLGPFSYIFNIPLQVIEKLSDRF